jgi:hypothetical protein
MSAEQLLADFEAAVEVELAKHGVQRDVIGESDGTEE